MNCKFVKGIIEALGFKNVLKVDFSPKKTCNFDCVYCGVGRTSTWLNERSEFYPVEDVFFEIDYYIEHNGEIRYVMLTGSGEPALYKGFGELVAKIKQKYPNLKIMAYTNCSLLSRKDVHYEFLQCDVLGCNLNAVYNDEFQKICQPFSPVRLKDALNGLVQFKKVFKGVIFVDSKFVKDLNDTHRNLNGLIEYLADLKPDRYIAVIRNYKGTKPTDEFVNLVKQKVDDLHFTTKVYV
ncbi:MAG: radical SAM protein [Candidatus Heimdallarchaeota archaeon]